MSVRIHYSGRDYAVPGRNVTELRDQIDQGLLSDLPYWLPVKYGDGRSSDAFLLITPGAMIGLIVDLDVSADAGDARADPATGHDDSGDTGPFDAFPARSHT